MKNLYISCLQAQTINYYDLKNVTSSFEQTRNADLKKASDEHIKKVAQAIFFKTEEHSYNQEKNHWEKRLDSKHFNNPIFMEQIFRLIHSFKANIENRQYHSHRIPVVFPPPDEINERGDAKFSINFTNEFICMSEDVYTKVKKLREQKLIERGSGRNFR